MNSTEIAKIRYHLNYPMVVQGQDLDSYFQSLIPIDYDLNGVLLNLSEPEHAIILGILFKLDELEQNIFDARINLSALKVDTIEINNNQIKQLLNLYDLYRERLMGCVDHRQAFRNSKYNCSSMISSRTH
jgi:hypothetical protein